MGEEISVLVEIAELHEEIFDSDDIFVISVPLTESFVEVEIPLTPGDAVTEVLFSSFLSAGEVDVEIDDLRFEPL